MAARGTARILRERIDDETVNETSTMMDESSRSMAEHIIQTVGDRFERRLTEETSQIDRRLTEEVSQIARRLTDEVSRIDRRLTEEVSRIDRRLTEEISSVRVEVQGGRVEVQGIRVEMHKGFGELRAEIASGTDKATRWAVLLWVGQIGAIGGLLAYLR